MIEKGAQVHENQPLFCLPDVSTMAVDVEVHESWVDQVNGDLPALASIDALPNLNLKGRVSKVGILPDSVNRLLNPDLKVYLTEITIEDNPQVKLLRPGMSAKVQVIITILQDVLYVPIQSVTTINKQQVCYVLEGGDFVPRPVQGGKYNESFIEIVSGLEEGGILQLNAPPPQGGRQTAEGGEARDVARAIKSSPQGEDRGSKQPGGNPYRKPKEKWAGKQEKKEGDAASPPAGELANPPLISPQPSIR